jgi:hypothetical protein
MNAYHKKKLKRKILRQIEKGRKFNGFKWKYKTILYKWPSLGLCSEIVGIMPMNGPVGQVFHINYIHESLSNN